VLPALQTGSMPHQAVAWAPPVALSSAPSPQSSDNVRKRGRHHIEEEDDDDDDERTHGRAQQPRQVSTMSRVVPSVLQLLVDDLQDLRRSVKSVKKDASRLSSRQICFGNMQHGTRLWRVCACACVCMSA
jgi:hypothetical protein